MWSFPVTSAEIKHVGQHSTDGLKLRPKSISVKRWRWWRVWLRCYHPWLLFWWGPIVAQVQIQLCGSFFQKCSLRLTASQSLPLLFSSSSYFPPPPPQKKKTSQKRLENVLDGFHERFFSMIEDTTVHSEIFSQTLFDFKKSISGPIELKFSGKTLYAIL